MVTLSIRVRVAGNLERNWENERVCSGARFTKSEAALVAPTACTMPAPPNRIGPMNTKPTMSRLHARVSGLGGAEQVEQRPDQEHEGCRPDDRLEDDGPRVVVDRDRSPRLSLAPE